MARAPAHDPKPRSRRRRALAVGIGAGCLLLAVASRQAADDTVRVAAAAPVGAQAPAPRAAAVAPAAAEEAPLPEPIQRYLDAHPYPPTSGRLGPQHEDLLRPNRRYERPRPIPATLSDDPAQVVSVLFTADRYYYTGDDTAEATLQAWRGDRPIPLHILQARATAESRDGDTELGFPFGLVWSGEGYAARLPMSRFADHLGPIQLEVRFEYEPGRTHEESLRLFNTPRDRIPARLTGRLRDSVRDGNLHLDVGIDVEAAGFYRFDANLLDEDGDPVAFAAFKGELDRGDSSVPLEVFGKVLRDAGVPGPYQVADVRGYRFLDGQYPDRERLPDSSLTWRTQPYALSDFSDARYVSDHQQRMVELMLEDLANGITLDVPELPAAGAPIGPRPPDDDAEVPLPTPPAEPR